MNTFYLYHNRAKFQLLCVGNVHGTLLQAGKTLRALARDALDRNLVVALDLKQIWRSIHM